MTVRRYVAMDPGNTVGWADSHDGRLVRVTSFDYYEDIGRLFARVRAFAREQALFLLERPEKGSARTRSRDVGRCEEKALTLAALAKAHGGQVKLVAPSKFTKLSATQFSCYWPKHQGRSNEHGRDAGMILWAELKKRGLR